MSTFQRGQYASFRATTKIHLGRYETDIMEHDHFDYDGHTVRYGGMEYSVPQLRTLMGDWYVPSADMRSTYRAKPANVEVRAATPEGAERGAAFTMEEASDENSVVGTMDEQKAIREAASNNNQERLAELRAQRENRTRRRVAHQDEPGQVNLDTNPSAPPPENADDIDPDVEAALMEDAIPQEPVYRRARAVDEREGEPQAKPPEVTRAEAINKARIEAERARLDAIDRPRTRAEMGGQRHDQAEGTPGKRRVARGGYEVINEDAGGTPVGRTYKFSDGATVGEEGVSGEARRTDVTKVGSRQPVQVGNAVAQTPRRKAASGAEVIDDPATLHEPQAARARSSTQVSREGNVGIDEIGPGGATGDVDQVMSGDDLADLLPGAAVAGRVEKKYKAAPPPAQSEADEIAEVTSNWSTKRHWQKRVSEAVEFYGDWPEALDAIYEIESDAVVKQIKSRLAEA